MKKKVCILSIIAAIFVVLALGCVNSEKIDSAPHLMLDQLEVAELITEEWKTSGHQFAITAPVERGIDCAKCHDGYVFSEQLNLAGVDYILEHPTGIDCQACHSGYGKELIKTGVANVPFSSESIEAGSGAVCYTCHNGNRDPEGLYAQSEQGTLERFSYPHYGMSGALVSGLGGMEIPNIEYPTTLAHSNLEQSCIQCHMPETKDGYKKHSFTMDIEYFKQTCGDCHEGSETFNINGFQDEIKIMLTTLETAILDITGAVTIETGGGVFTYIDSNGQAIENISHQAYVATYNWRMILKDGSYGVHNPEYAKALLQESYKSLTGKEL